MTAYVQYAIDKCESLGSGQQLILHGNPSVLGQDFPRKGQSVEFIFAEYALPVLYDASGHSQWQF